jgi:hypothetical protein
MCTMPPVYSFISFTSFNYKRATQYSGVPTTEYNGIEYDVDRGLYHWGEKILVVIHIQVNRKYENWYFKATCINWWYFQNCKQLLQKISWRSTKNQTTDSKLNTYMYAYMW